MFRLPTKTIVKRGALDLVSDLVGQLGARRVYLIFDDGLESTAWPSVVQQSLSKTGAIVELFTDVSPNPRAFEVDRAADMARSFDADLVVGLGGGSVLDTAKAVAMLCKNEGSCLDFEGKEVFSQQPIPYVAIPTTCGTGSEVTWVSVISDPNSERKISIKGERMFPTYAVVDSDLIETLPPSLISFTGIDALTHAIEALVSKCSNPVSDALAVSAIQLILDHIEPCVDSPDDPTQRDAMMRGSTLAGIAFGNSDVGAVHCLSESIGGVFDHPHGLLNAQLLFPVMQYQFSDIQEKLNSVVEFNSANALLDRIEKLIRSLKIPTLASLQIPTAAVSSIARLAEQNNSNASNPRSMAADDYEKILTSLVDRN